MSYKAQKGFLKGLATKLKGNNSSTPSSTTDKFKHYATEAAKAPRAAVTKGAYFPVYVAVGMITLAAGFGIHTIRHQLSRSPNVYLKKSRRETVPEVVEPDRVVDHSDEFIKKSFFRKVAHVQDFDRQDVVDDPIRGDVFASEPKAETLKSVGVNPNPNPS